MISQVEIYTVFSIHSLQIPGSRQAIEVSAGYRTTTLLENYSTTVKMYGVNSIFTGSTGTKLKEKLRRTNYINKVIKS